MPPVEFRWPRQPRGEDWDYDDDEECFRRLPKLAAVYLADVRPAVREVSGGTNRRAGATRNTLSGV